MLARSRTGSACTFVKRVNQVCSSALKRRKQAKADAGQHGNQQRDQQHCTVNTDLAGTWYVWGTNRDQSLDGPTREQQSESTCYQRKQQAFGQHLLGDAEAAGPKCESR